MKPPNDDIADPILYRTYYSIMLMDVLEAIGLPTTKENKELVHEYHKTVLGYDSISGLSHAQLSFFLLEVTIYWAERGLFVRTNRKQFKGIEKIPLSLIWDRL